MVAKISIGSSLYGAICYNGEKINEAKGRILAANKIILPPDGKVSINGMVENFKVFMPKMGRTKKPVLHISLNPHPDVIGNFVSTKNGKIEKPANGKIQSPVHPCLDIKKAFVILGLQTKTDKRQWKSMTNYQNSPCGAKLRNLFQMG